MDWRVTEVSSRPHSESRPPVKVDRITKIEDYARYNLRIGCYVSQLSLLWSVEGRSRERDVG